jgi:hypothetical protein
MEIEVSDATALPQWLQPHVAGGKLNLAAIPAPEDVSGLKTALQKERENAQAWAKLGDKPDAVAKRIADLEKAAQGTGKGAEEAQAKLDAMKADYDGKLSERDKRFRTVLEKKAVSDLKAELAQAGVVPEGLDLLAAFGKQRIQFTDDGDVKVTTDDGKPMIGSGADHGATLGDLAKELAGKIPHLVADKGNGGSGKQPNSGGKPEQKTVTRSQFDAMSQSERAEFSKSGGKVVS